MVGIVQQAVIKTVCIGFCIKGIAVLVIGFFCFFHENQWKKSVIRTGFFLLAFFLGILHFSVSEMEASPLQPHIGQVISVEGTVQSITEKEKSVRILLDAQSFSLLREEQDGICHPIKEHILLTVWQEDGVSKQGLSGRRVSVKGMLELPQGQRNPGCFDYAKYLRSKNIRFVILVKNGQLEVKATEQKDLQRGLAIFKDKGSKAIKEAMSSEKYGLLVGMLFGDKSFLEEELYEKFQKNGIAHILAVSGIHVNLLYIYISRFFKGRPKKARSVFILLFLFFYAALAEFSPSVVRAALMIAIHILGSLLLQRYDMLNGICFSCLLQILNNPYILFHMGFQLSYLAAFSLAIILPWVDSRIDRLVLFTKREWVGMVGKFFSPLFVLQLVMAPAMVYQFNYFSFVAFLLNPPIIFLAGMVIPLGMSLLFLCWLPNTGGGFFEVVTKAVTILLEVMLRANEFFANWGKGTFCLVSPPLGILILFYGGIFFFCTEIHCILYRRGKKRYISSVFVLIVVCACFLPWAADKADAPHPFSRKLHQLTFVDVGQGDCLHIRTPSGKNVLIDGGGSTHYEVGKKVLLPYLLKNGAGHIDLAIVTHLHTDHFKGIQELSVYMPVERLGVYEINAIRPEALALGTDFAFQRAKEDQAHQVYQEHQAHQAHQTDTKILYLKKGNRILLDKDIWVEILAPEGKSNEEYKALLLEEDENATSLVIKVSYLGLTVLMTGDMGFDGENKLMQGVRNINCHILKVGHHGSAYSTSKHFLQEVDPKVAVIQVGKNNYGHPASRVIELFQNYDIMIFRNDLQGAVFLDGISEGNAKIETLRSLK